MHDDHYWMQHAIELALQAEKQDEVPVGAIIVRKNKIVGKGWNQPISTNDPTAHAEIIALRDAAQNLKNYRLVDTTLYVTLEPCFMCVGAMIHARIKKLVFGAFDPKTGVIKSIANVLDNTKLNHRLVYKEGILADECGKLLSDFFIKKRKAINTEKI